MEFSGPGGHSVSPVFISTYIAARAFTDVSCAHHWEREEESKGQEQRCQLRLVGLILHLQNLEILYVDYRPVINFFHQEVGDGVSKLNTFISTASLKLPQLQPQIHPRRSREFHCQCTCCNFPQQAVAAHGA